MQAIQFRIARPTNNLIGITRFYTEGLGLPVIGAFRQYAGYDGVMIGLPGQDHHLEFTQQANPVNTAAPSGDHLLVLYFDTPEVYELAIQRLKVLGCHRLHRKTLIGPAKAKPLKMRMAGG